MGAATTEWEQRHGKSASSKARRRAAQRLREDDNNGVKTPGMTARVFVREDEHERLRQESFAKLVQMRQKMNSIAEYTESQYKATGKFHGKSEVIAVSNMLIGACELHVHVFEYGAEDSISDIVKAAFDKRDQYK